jgi:hypothetical protein
MVEKINLRDVEGNIIDVKTKEVLKNESRKYINNYYRAEGTFVFSFITLMLTIFLWDEISDPLFFMLFTTCLNLILMVYFLFKHLKFKGVF